MLFSDGAPLTPVGGSSWSLEETGERKHCVTAEKEGCSVGNPKKPNKQIKDIKRSRRQHEVLDVSEGNRRPTGRGSASLWVLMNTFTARRWSVITRSAELPWLQPTAGLRNILRHIFHPAVSRQAPPANNYNHRLRLRSGWTVSCQCACGCRLSQTPSLNRFVTVQRQFFSKRRKWRRTCKTSSLKSEWHQFVLSAYNERSKRGVWGADKCMTYKSKGLLQITSVCRTNPKMITDCLGLQPYTWYKSWHNY